MLFLKQENKLKSTRLAGFVPGTGFVVIMLTVFGFVLFFLFSLLNGLLAYPLLKRRFVSGAWRHTFSSVGRTFLSIVSTVFVFAGILFISAKIFVPPVGLSRYLNPLIFATMIGIFFCFQLLFSAKRTRVQWDLLLLSVGVFGFCVFLYFYLISRGDPFRGGVTFAALTGWGLALLAYWLVLYFRERKKS